MSVLVPPTTSKVDWVKLTWMRPGRKDRDRAEKVEIGQNDLYFPNRAENPNDLKLMYF